MRKINGTNWWRPKPVLALPERQPDGTPTVSFRSPRNVPRRAGSTWATHWIQLVRDHPTTATPGRAGVAHGTLVVWLRRSTRESDSPTTREEAPATVSSVDDVRRIGRYIAATRRPASRASMKTLSRKIGASGVGIQRTLRHLEAAGRVTLSRRRISGEARRGTAPNKKPDGSARPQPRAAT